MHVYQRSIPGIVHERDDPMLPAPAAAAAAAAVQLHLTLKL